MAVVPERRSAWISSSVPKSKAQIWVEYNGVLEPDAFQADFLFAESSEAADVQRIFKSKEFLEGHLTVFSSDIIIHAAKQETVNHIDIMKCILLPKKELNDLGITSRCFTEKEDAKRNVRNEKNSLGRFHDIRKQYPLRSKKSSTKDNVSNSSSCTEEMKSTLESSSAKSADDDCILEISSTTTPPVSKKNDSTNRQCGIFYHSLNFEITHLADIDVPQVRLMDFIPGLDGCRVMKRPTKLCEEITI